MEREERGAGRTPISPSASLETRTFLKKEEKAREAKIPEPDSTSF